jgi:uncharacterized protein
VAECVLPWLRASPRRSSAFGLRRIDDDQLLEPLARSTLHFDADDLDDAEALLQLIDTLEPPADLAEAVQDVVRSVMLLADVTQPLAPAAASRRPARRPPRRR